MTNGKLLAVTLAVLLAPASAHADAITINGTVSLGSSLGLINDGDRKSYAYGGTTRNLALLMRGCPIKMGETVPCVVKFNADGENVTEIISAVPPSLGGVELVLDVGNSRTHGMLIERFPNEATIDLATSYTLSIRDLQKPHVVYEGSFASDVELFEARFGDDDLSQRAGGRRAFFWPSAVRVGPEVANIRQEQQGTELYSGLSSPKRYLWDVTPRVQEWRFPENQYVRDIPPLIGRILRNRVNASGDVLGSIAKERRQYQRISGRVNERRADAMTYSRSSF